MNDYDDLNNLMAMQRLMLSQNLYGDKTPATKWQLFCWRWRNRLGRIRDAWDVLLGRAHVE